jgi:hypothetical protein
MSETLTALEARRLRLIVGKPLAEVDRLWRLESLEGLAPGRLVPFEKVGQPVDYRELARLEAEAGLPWP